MNHDVRSSNPIVNLFIHDFWGQDIGLSDSHKSYRPLTVLTYKLDHLLYGLNAFGYHATNILIYISSCISVYCLVKLWLSKKGMVAAWLNRVI
jgi:hypothetical protein